MAEQGRLAQTMADLDQALPDTRTPSSSFASRGFRSLTRRLGIQQEPERTPHAHLYREIANSIERGASLPIPPAEAMASLELCMAAYESAITGKETALPMTASNLAYNGLSKQNYDARKGVRVATGQTKPKTRAQPASRYEVRIGLIGLDTSHAPTFTSLLHNPNDPFHIPGARIVAAFPGGSPDMNISISRVPGFTAELRDKYGIPILDSPEQVAEACDLVFILSSDGRTHPGLFRSIAGRGKPVFIDKPFAISAADAELMFRIAGETGTKFFSSSAYRYADGLVNALHSIREAEERVKTCEIRSWLPIEETQGRYFWYGIHGSDMLLASMGRGVHEVQATGDAQQDVIAVVHSDGRTSRIVGSRVDGRFQVELQTDKRKLSVDLAASTASVSARMLWTALDVLTDRKFPRLWAATETGSVSGQRLGRALDPSPEETLEVVRLLDAAQRSFASQQKIAL